MLLPISSRGYGPTWTYTIAQYLFDNRELAQQRPGQVEDPNPETLYARDCPIENGTITKSLRSSFKLLLQCASVTFCNVLAQSLCRPSKGQVPHDLGGWTSGWL